MKFSVSIIIGVATMAVAGPIETRQSQGGATLATYNLFGGGGCVLSNLIFSLTISGAANVCQPLDPQNSLPNINSFNATSIAKGCRVTLFYDAACTDPSGNIGFAAPVGTCTQVNKPFEGVYVSCPA